MCRKAKLELERQTPLPFVHSQLRRCRRRCVKRRAHKARASAASLVLARARARVGAASLALPLYLCVLLTDPFPPRPHARTPSLPRRSPGSLIGRENVVSRVECAQAQRHHDHGRCAFSGSGAARAHAAGALAASRVCWRARSARAVPLVARRAPSNPSPLLPPPPPPPRASPAPTTPRRAPFTCTSSRSFPSRSTLTRSSPTFRRSRGRPSSGSRTFPAARPRLRSSPSTATAWTLS